MKPIIAILFICMIALMSNCKPSHDVVLRSEYIALQDSIQLFKVKTTSLASEKETFKDSIEVIKQDQERTLRSVRTLRDSVEMMQDSIDDLLIRPMMTNEHFIMIYNYLSLRKYYLLCVKKPENRKFYFGWSARVFEDQSPVIQDK